MEENLEFIRSNKGGMKVIHKGYIYTVHKKSQGRSIRWRCSQRKLNCKGSITTLEGHNFAKINVPHNHLPDFHLVAAAKIKHEEFDDITQFLEVGCDNVSDSVPINQRIGKTIARQDSTTQNQLHSQPISPTKLKVTRQVASKSPKFINVKPKPPEPAPNISNEEVCLRWNSHHNNMQTSFPYLLKKEQFVDVTLVADGKMLKCHKVILSSCSSYFESILESIERHQHPVIFLRGIPFWVLKSLTDFMYVGEVNIVQSKLQELLEAAELLKIKGLAGKTTDKKEPEELKLEKEEPKTKEAPPMKALYAPVSRMSLLKPLAPKRVEEDWKTSVGPYMKPAVLPPEQIPITDPLDLMEPLYQEETRLEENILSVNKQKEYPKVYCKKNINKKLKKRKGSDIDEELSFQSSMPIRLRRGTRSRPNIKVPKYYHSDFDTNDDETDPLSNTTRIKTEPVDPDFDPIESRVQSLNHILRPENDSEGVLITGIEEDRMVPVPGSQERTETPNNHPKDGKEKNLDSTTNMEAENNPEVGIDIGETVLQTMVSDTQREEGYQEFGDVQDTCGSEGEQKRNEEVSKVEGTLQEAFIEKERDEKEEPVGDFQITEVMSLNEENLEKMGENVANLVNEEEKEEEKNDEGENMDCDPCTQDKGITSSINDEEMQDQ